MSAALAVPIFAVGGVLLAVWLDVRRPAPTLREASIHGIAAFFALQALPPVLAVLEADRATSLRLGIILLLIVLPVFVYAFFGAARLLRLLAAAWSFR